MARWRTGGQYELTVLLDKEAWFLQVKNPSVTVLAKLGELERELEDFIQYLEETQ